MRALGSRGSEGVEFRANFMRPFASCFGIGPLACIYTFGLGKPKSTEATLNYGRELGDSSGCWNLSALPHWRVSLGLQFRLSARCYQPTASALDVAIHS
jgi:hypothetical protein